MASFAAARSILRSSPAARSAAPRFSAAAKPKSNPFSPSSFNLPKQKTLSAPRIFRSPVELSCCVESLMPYHTATASALLNSMLSAAPRSAGWTPEGKDQTR
ncbi:protein NUCLEAR FUSION DEFECTIVE 6, chloroplastic/mitochondrial-like isoform X1 [Chenopodium quinoa]|uniref:protein NUCLEAR FUSION DEFECTIVE 6, chloroplastic/mitochondrial-like isoform X1 n=1 Tax=Chenopodium quinoa TaxID=63459 RepID=UPI000B79215B|nr:protein NUCLEAR FUSION DEFECTIVE 6, chloroplastic/mitochondrial-like isoform X1 [Chenopodium quinoa]